MLAGIFRGLFYLYVMLALAPLAVLSVAFAASVAMGADPWLWPFGGSMAVISPMADSDDRSSASLVTFRSQPLALPKTQPDANLYAIGVGTTKTSTPRTREEIQETMLSEGYYVADQGAARTGLHGTFTNVLLWDKRTGGVRKIFDKQVAARAVVPVDTAADKAIVILAADRDTNKDGRIGATDIQSAFVFHLRDGTLHAVRNLPGSAAVVEDASEPGYLLVRVVRDQNKDGAAFATSSPYAMGAEEPRSLYRIDLKTFEATPLVPDAMVGELQSELDALAADPKKP